MMHRLSIVATLAATQLASAAWAQSTAAAPSGTDLQDDRLGEVVVTARRVDENQQTTPVATTAFGRRDLAELGVDTVRDLGGYVPNLAATRGPTANGSDANFFIRGIGQEDSNAVRDPGVGVYLDGVYIGRTVGSALETLDIERVEVLRGPQGTLFGRNTVGGAVNVVTSRPDGRQAGAVDVTLGERNRRDVRARFSFPIHGDRLAASIALASRNQDGWVRRVVDDRTLGDIATLAARGKLAAKIGDTVDAVLAADYTRSRGTVAPTVLAAVNPTLRTPFGVPLPAGITTQLCPERWCDHSFMSTALRNPVDVWGTSLTIDWRVGDHVTLRSLSSYRALRATSSPDFDASSFVIYDQVVPTRQWQASQELQAIVDGFGDRLKLVSGLFYYREATRQNTSIAFGSNQNALAPVPEDQVLIITTNQFIRPTVESYAGYAQASLAITPALSLTAGARLTHERKSIDYNIFIDNRRGGSALSVVPPFRFFPRAILRSAIPSRTKDWTPFTWRIGAEYRASPDVFLYGSVATGFRSGGFNGRPTSAAEATAFEPEKTLSYEVGVKSELFDHHLRINVAAFRTRYTDIQVIVQKPGQTFLSFDNTDARNQGFEVELSARPAGGVRLDASVGYLDSTILRTVSSGVRAGVPLAQSPRWTVRIGPAYRVDLPGGGSLAARIDYRYKSRHRFFNSSTANGEQPGFGLWNARLGWTSADGGFDLAVYGENVFGKKYIVQGSDNLTSFGTFITEPAPRAEFGVTAAVHF